MNAGTSVAGPARLTDVALTALAPAAWGLTYLATTEFLPPGRPLLAGAVRALPAGLLLAATARQRPVGTWWLKAAALGVLNIGGFFALLFVAAYRLPGGVAATLGAVQPLVAAGLATALLRERIPAAGRSRRCDRHRRSRAPRAPRQRRTQRHRSARWARRGHIDGNGCRPHQAVGPSGTARRVHVVATHCRRLALDSTCVGGRRPARRPHRAQPDRIRVAGDGRNRGRLHAVVPRYRQVAGQPGLVARPGQPDRGHRVRANRAPPDAHRHSDDRRRARAHRLVDRSTNRFGPGHGPTPT